MGKTPSPKGNARLSGGTLLVVEDEADVRAIIATYARGIGFAVLEAAHGLQALELLSQEAIDVVISDMAMPEMSGYELLQEIRSRGSRLPFLAVSGFADHKIILECMKLDVFDYLEKPFEVASLKSILREAMRVSLAELKLGSSPERLPGHGSLPAAGVAAKDLPAKDEWLIKRLQVLSEGKDSGDDGGKKDSGNLPPAAQLRRMFVEEALGQLAHSEKAIRSLSEGGDVQWELGYLNRVMSFLKQAVEVISQPELLLLIEAIRQAVAVYRIRVSLLGARELQLLRKAHKLLIVAIKDLPYEASGADIAPSLSAEITACIHEIQSSWQR